MTHKFIIMGCGNSAGTPTIGNYWGNCDPEEPRNKRLRASAAVVSDLATVIIDTGPDFRYQMNRLDIRHIDGVLYTHAHGDHICGIDELRVLRFRGGKLMDIYGSQETIKEISERFNYIFIQRHDIYPRVIESHIFTPEEHYYRPQSIADISFIPFEQDHGTCMSLGYRFGDLAYSTDVIRLDEKAIATLKGVKTWIVDGAGYMMEKNEVHFTLKQIYEMNEIIKAEKVYITHMTPGMDYKTMCKDLPAGFEPAYDGLTIEFKY